MTQVIIPEVTSLFGDFLTILGENNLFTLNVKEVDTQKYCMNNAVCAEMWGLSETGLVGMTTREVLGRASDLTRLDEELDKAAALERKVVEQGRQGSRIQVVLACDGFVHVRQLLVTPVIGLLKVPVAIMTTAHERTREVNLLNLLDLYKKCYANKLHAVSKLLDYLKFNEYFIQSISCEELRTLLAISESARHKRAAQRLGISPKTVASYLSSVKSKLRPNVHIQDLLTQLRRFHQWEPEISTYKP